jgi:hypothetical protein
MGSSQPGFPVSIFRHLHQRQVPEETSVDDRGYRAPAAPSKEAPTPQVWHVLRLHNTSDRPWTTAPAFALNG